MNQPVQTGSGRAASLGVGWDVGGWRGAKQAVAVLSQRGDERSWCGSPTTFTIDMLRRAGGSVVDLIRLAWRDAPTDCLDRYQVVIAIDAPLGFPLAFQQLVTRQSVGVLEFGREIDNRLAYRETERWVHQIFGKKPLSAAFDKLGNNVTVAMYHATRWAAEGPFRIMPYHVDEGGPTIIEVYPALAKDPATGIGARRIIPLLPEHVAPHSDEYDAAICAVHALAYALSGQDDAIPMLDGPPESVDWGTVATEGWIYSMSPNWLGQAEICAHRGCE